MGRWAPLVVEDPEIRAFRAQDIQIPQPRAFWAPFGGEMRRWAPLGGESGNQKFWGLQISRTIWRGNGKAGTI